MANIALELQQILSAIYGEEVRGSIHNAIDKINKVGEKTLNSGTDIEEGDPAGGYYDNSLYINTANNDLLRCNGTTWIKIGSIKGEEGNGIASITGPVTVGLVDTYTITMDDGTSKTFDVTNAKSITSITGPVTVGLVDTYTINYNDGTSDTIPVTNGKGISNVTKTATVDLVDTYTILYNDGTSSTFNVTNGVNGNRWYRGTGVSGKSVNPTKFIGSGVAYANVNDFYINITEGAVYHCDTAGNDSTALWAYDFTMTGGGSGGTEEYPDLLHKPSINGVTLNGDLSTKDLLIKETAVKSSAQWDSIITDPTELAKYNNGDPVILTDDDTDNPTWIDGNDFIITNGIMGLKKKIKTYYSEQATIIGSEYRDFAIGFGFIFASIPVIMAIFVSDDPSFVAENTKLSTVVTYKSNSGCSINVSNFGTAPITGHLEIIVIG